MRARAPAIGLFLLAGAFAGLAHAEPQSRTTSSTAAIIAEYEAAEASENGPGHKEEQLPSFGAAFFQMLVVLIGVCALAYLILAKGLPKLMRIEQPSASRKVLQVVDRLPIDQRRSIMVIKIANEYFLVGASDGGINLISRLEPETIEGALQRIEPAPSGPKLSRLAELIKRSPEKKEG